MDTKRSDLVYFPRQALSDKKKTKKWAKECIDIGEALTVFEDSRIRQSTRKKRVNYNLVNNILSNDDVSKIVDPWGLNAETFPANAQNYPIIMPRLNVLIGEELKRKFDFRIRVGNANAISEKEEELKNRIHQIASEAIQNPKLTKEELQKKLKKIAKWHKYEYQDLREIQATELSKYFYKTQNLDTKFNDCFTDLLVASEEIASVDIYGNSPEVEKLSPLEVHTLSGGSSNKIEDSDLIVIERMESVGKVIDKYYDDLTDKEVKKLEYNTIESHNEFLNIGMREPAILIDGSFDATVSQTGLITVNDQGLNPFDNYYDTQGNVRVCRVLWRSKRKLLKIKYYDNFGNEQLRYEDERYKVNIEAGEKSIGHIWVNEWWEGTKIAKDIYIRMKPRFSARDMDNPSKCNPGIIGNIHNIDLNEGISLVDVMKPYQYLYNIFMYRTELAFAKSHGKVVKVDPSLIPDNMELEEWFHYLTNMGVMLEDPFTESNIDKGNANLSQMSRGAKDIDLTSTAYINQHLSMMRYVDQQCGRIAGITPEREGQISNRETVGGIERSVTQSNHITERYFALHENFKKRVIESLLETAKYCWRNYKTKKLQYVMNDFSNKIVNIDVEQFKENNYDVHVSYGNDSNEIEQVIKQLSQSAMQNEKMNISDLISIYMSDSISDMRRRVETSEEEAIERAKEQLESQRAAAQEKIEADQIEKEKERIHKSNENDLDRRKEITLKDMEIAAKQYSELANNSQHLELEKQEREHEDNDKNREVKREEIKTKKEIEMAKMKNKTK